ncbi:MAG: signal peptidase I [Bacteroidota bacterium]
MAASRRRARAKVRHSNSFGKARMKAELKAWGQSLGFAAAVGTVVFTFIIQPFVVPTPSMAATILPGDRILVSKLHYGPSTPRTLAIPFTDLYLPGVEFPATRLPGFSTVQRGDAIVFHYPRETGPIDRKPRWFKRIVGLPGDAVLLRDKVTYVNGSVVEPHPNQQQWWQVTLTDARMRLNAQRVFELGAEQVRPLGGSNTMLVMGTQAMAEALAGWSYVATVTPYLVSEAMANALDLFPSGAGYTTDNYGPITVPKAGTTVALTDETWPQLERVIREYEGHTAQRRADGSFWIDGAAATTFTFAQDYYFVMGDNRDNSEDSRFWGFVPHDHLIGKPVAIFFSHDPETFIPRLDRIFTRVP